MAISICAVVAARNEGIHLRRVLSELGDQGIDVAVIDHGSEDETAEIVEEFRECVVSYQYREFSGEFSLSDQLNWKRELIAGLRHDWFVHQDADESLRHANSVSSLRDAIEQASSEGYNTIDFNEFVFLPYPKSKGCPPDFISRLYGYYFFQPNMPSRLNRAWKRCEGLEGLSSGGHRVVGPARRCSPIKHELRHYIGMSEEHLQKKYGARRFSADELNRGWHRNRVGLSPSQLSVPEESSGLIKWGDGHVPLRTDLPVRGHYWSWPRDK